MKTLTSIGLVLMVFVSSALATVQQPDKIIYDANEYSLHNNPMQSYFTRYPEKIPKTGLKMSSLWRGYIATFEFKNEILLLKDIEAYYQKEKGKSGYLLKSFKDELVPKGEILTIDWFTGFLVLPYGKLLHYVHNDYQSTYSNYILLEIDKGNLTAKRTFVYKQYMEFKERQFQAFKKTEEYKKWVEKVKKNGVSPEDIDSHIRNYIVGITSKFLVEETPPNKPLQ